MLTRLADDPTVDLLVVHKLDRLARNLEDHAAVRAALRKAGVQLHSVTESLEDSASGKLVEGILASIAEFYSANLGQEIRKGMDQKAAQGGWPVRAPFGYRNVRRDGGRRGGESLLEPDQQAPIVVWAFERYATGSLSVAALTEALAEKGLRNRLGNPPGISAVHRMLRSPVYAGVVRWKGAEHEGIHQPLISRELFDQVQSALDAHSTGGERSWKHDHYLKGTLVCAECGSKLYYALAKRRFGYFRCIGRNTRRTGCSQGRYVPAAELEREVEALYEGVRVPASLRPGWSGSSKSRSPSGSRTERRSPPSFHGAFTSSQPSERSSFAPTMPTRLTSRSSSASRLGSTRRWPTPSHSSRPTGRSWRRRSRSSTSR
jgi:hypothetical protein